MKEKIYIHGQVQTKEPNGFPHENQYKEEGGMDIVKRAEENKGCSSPFNEQK